MAFSFQSSGTPSFGGAGGSFAFGSAPATAPSNPFGTPATPAPANPFGGASSAFGAPATPANPFGAASAPAAAPATPAFSFSSFGAQSTPAPAGSGLFGSTTPAPAFGQQAASSGGIFGTPAPASAPGFGTPAASGSIFGTPAPAAAPGSIFGASTGSSLFGTSTALALPQQQQPQQQLGAFGAFGAPPAPAPQQQVPGLTDASGLGPDDAVRAISKVVSAYSKSSPEYRFQYLFLSVVTDPAQRVKPPNVDETRWRQAMAAAGGPDNPDKLWPVVACGFKDLLARSKAQQDALAENQARLQALTDTANKLHKRHATELKQRATEMQRRHVELSHGLLKVTRHVDALESRLAMAVGYNGLQSRAKDQQVASQLSQTESELAPTAAAGLQRRLDAVAAAARLRVGGPTHSSSSQARLDDSSLAQIFSVLRDHAEGVRQLQEVLKRDALDLQIMSKGLPEPMVS